MALRFIHGSGESFEMEKIVHVGAFGDDAEFYAAGLMHNFPSAGAEMNHHHVGVSGFTVAQAADNVVRDNPGADHP